MIDLIIQGTKTNIRTLLQHPMLADNPYIDFCWWAGTGKFPTSNFTLDANGNVATEPTYAPNFVGLLRVRTPADDIASPVDMEQWSRSRIAKYIKDNGTQGTTLGIPYYELNGVRMMKADSVMSWLAANNLSGHTWAGGNSL